VALFEGGPKKVVDANASVQLKDESEAGFVDLAKQVSALVVSHAGAEHYAAFLKYVLDTPPVVVSVHSVVFSIFLQFTVYFFSHPSLFILIS
jgi:hypothetical protein